MSTQVAGENAQGQGQGRGGDGGGYAFEQFTAVRRYQPTLAFSPDGGEVAYSTNTSGQFNLWRQSSDGHYPHQLTLYSEEAVREVAWSPDGDAILFTADRQGDEFRQVYLIPARGGRPAPLTVAPQAQFNLASEPWSPDGRLIAYAGNDREPTDQDAIVRDVRGSEVGRPMTGALYQPVNWSPDGKRLTVVEVTSNTNLDVHVVSLADGTSRHLTPHEGEVRYLPGPWAADGSGFYLVTDEGREFLGLAFQDAESGERRWVETPDWDVEQVAMTGEGRYLAWAVNEEGYSKLHVRDLESGEELDLPALPDGVIGVLTASQGGGKLGLILNRPQHPTEVYVLDLASGALTQLTHGFLGGIDEEDLIRPELVRFPTFDGREIPGFLYRPRGAGPFPVVLSIHGGPESQERPGYAAIYQYLLSRGIGVLAPNIRGSTGYGKAYQVLIHRDFGGDDLKDFKAAARYLRGLDWVDGDRLGVFGGSYGGFAVLSCVSRLPDYWAAAVDIVGPSNLVTFAKAVPPIWRRFMAAWVGDPETETDFLMERSPITYVDQIRAPLFVIQGAKDPRVVKAESDQIVERLRARNVAVRYDVYEDEGHGFTKRENELRAWRGTAAFFEEHLLGAAAAD
ncbi:MAG: S9 family peptidase [Chloroflexota bacterium]|nr:S9 family peptidase [Chloroflexota bacterium]